MSPSQVFLSPGFFGFKTLGSFDYFCHIDAGLRRRFRDAGRAVEVHVVDVHPTASIRRRASTLIHDIAQLSGTAGPIHLIGHSTGGLDARLVASPTINIDGTTGQPVWAGRLRSVTTMNTPHLGTPLASFFATVSGQRLLAALSALTVVALKLGGPPLALTSSLVAAFGRVDSILGVELDLVDRITDRIVTVLDDASNAELRRFMRHLRDDQGAIIQLSPEAMDLFQAGIEDNPTVRYQCTVSYAPGRKARDWGRALLSPWANLSAPIFATLHRLTSLENAVYPCLLHGAEGERMEKALTTALGHAPPPNACDGVVPLRSQVWGPIVWAGQGDHLDVMGHFDGRASRIPHTDWMCSGAGYDLPRFEAMLDAIAHGMITAETTI
jgi:hypothetical protein